MPAEAGTVDAGEAGRYEPGGASCDRLAEILSRSGSAEILRYKRIAAWHDAAVIASDAHPGALIISSPLKSHRSLAMPGYL
ncbi:MAG: hypothetical protein WCE79_18595 [Xanthobacteraceae bacterium]